MIQRAAWPAGEAASLLGVSSGTALVNLLPPLGHPRMGSMLSAAHSTPLIEPPGFPMFRHGCRTAIASLAAHVAYGAIVGDCRSFAR